jgi:hypothetical protein
MRASRIAYRVSLCLFAAACLTANARADLSASCTFGSCTATVNSSSLQVTCDSASVYAGAFTMTTDFQNTTIQGDGTNAPTITAQGVPATGQQVNATLAVNGKTTAGSCGFAPVPTPTPSGRR